MAASKVDDGSKFFECKYCKEKFYPILAHDLHVMSKHPTEWPKAPCYSSGLFSLASDDLLKVAQSEFGSLKSFTIDNVEKSKSVVKWTATAAKEKEDVQKPVKRKREENPNDGTGDRNSDESGQTFKRPRIQAPDRSPAKEAAKKSKMMTTFVARNIALSRRNRLRMAGRPYYHQNSARWSSDHYYFRSSKNDETPESDTVVHAFRCCSKDFNFSNETKNQGAIYVFQPSNAADLLRNLTWKTTKALRQKNESTAGNEVQETAAPRFASRVIKKDFRRSSSERRRSSENRNDDRSYNASEYKNQTFSRRVNRGHAYDAHFNKVQSDCDAICTIKNCVHLYLFHSPAGERAATLKEEFSHTDVQGKEVLSGRSGIKKN